jgi:putative ABC transport system permease protein
VRGPRLSAMGRKSIADVRRRPGRSIVVVLAVMIGVSGVSCINVAERALSDDYSFTLARSGPHPDLSVVVDKTNLQLQSTISHLAGVRTLEESDVAATQWHVLRAPGHVDFAIVAYPDLPQVLLTPFQLLSGRSPGAAEIIMEYGDSAQQPVDIGNTVTVDTAAGVATLRVVGIARTAGQNPAVSAKSIGYMSTTGLSALPMHSFANGVPPLQPLVTHQLDLTLSTPSAWHAVADSINAAARAEGVTVLSVVPPQQGASIQGEQSIFTLVWVLIAVAVLLAALLLANTITALVAEEVRIIGTLKAIGATQWRVIRGYLTTVLIYGAVATPTGLVVGILLGQRLSGSMAASIPLAQGRFQLSAATIALGGAVGIGVPVLAALVPLCLGTRVSVRQALATWGVSSPRSQRSGPVSRWLSARLIRVRQTVWLGVRGLFRRPWHTALSVTTVAMAAVCFLIAQTLVTSLGASIASVWGNFSADVEVYASGEGATTGLHTLLDTVPGIARTERVGWYGDPTPWGKASVWGVEPDTQLFHPQLTAGRWFTAADHNVVILSDAMASRAHVPVGGSFPVTGPGGGASVSMTVIGTLKQSVDDLSQVGSMVMPVNQVYALEGADPATITDFTNRVLILATDRSATGVDRLTRAIDTAGRSAITAQGDGPIAELFLFHDEVVRHQRNFLPLYDLLYAMNLIVAAIGILGLADALSASVVHRRREIGLLRALGARGRRVGSVFIIEGLALSSVAWVLAGVVGVPLSYLFVGLFQRTVIPIDFHFNPLTLALMLLITALIASFAALVPALRAAALRAVDLLRHE